MNFKVFSEFILIPVALILGIIFTVIGLFSGKIQFFLLASSCFIFVLMLIDRLELKDIV